VSFVLAGGLPLEPPLPPQALKTRVSEKSVPTTAVFFEKNNIKI
jgi:hypothetical protein